LNERASLSSLLNKPLLFRSKTNQKEFKVIAILQTKKRKRKRKYNCSNSQMKGEKKVST
jgi:hypothetical protein